MAAEGESTDSVGSTDDILSNVCSLITATNILIQETRLNHRILIGTVCAIGAGDKIVLPLLKMIFHI